MVNDQVDILVYSRNRGQWLGPDARLYGRLIQAPVKAEMIVLRGSDTEKMSRPELSYRNLRSSLGPDAKPDP